mmetsp:Transcript_19600/g.42838  ORF Transcript_19600/g.42838 Transcript_19600/m.42838 type:complete len:203 (+) Transcript_19600:413-1021(+)
MVRVLSVRYPAMAGLFGVGTSGSLISNSFLPSFLLCSASCFALPSNHSCLALRDLIFLSSAPVNAGGGEVPSARKRPPLKTFLSPMALNILRKLCAARRSMSFTAACLSRTSVRIDSRRSWSISSAMFSISSSASVASSVRARPSNAKAFLKSALTSSCLILRASSEALRALCHWSIFKAALALLLRQARCMSLRSLFCCSR